MKLLSPVDKVEEVEPLIEAGADELFCGVLTPEWHTKYIAGSINRRPGGGANFTSLEQLQECVEAAHSHTVPVFLTLNEHYYTPKQYPYINEFIRAAIDIGVNGLIVADLAILLTLKEMKTAIRAVISTGGTTFNSETAAFYRDLGASRIILPRHLNLEEIGGICATVKGVEFETFIFNSRCPNVDGFCTFHHGLADQSIDALYKNACMLPYEISVEAGPEADTSKLSAKRQHIWQMVHVDDFPCGACGLYDFQKMGIVSVKIVGRGNATKRKLADVKFLKGLLEFMRDNDPSREEFYQEARRRYQKVYERPCRLYMCYYPEVLLK